MKTLLVKLPEEVHRQFRILWSSSHSCLPTLRILGMTRDPYELDPVTKLPNNDDEDAERQQRWIDALEGMLKERDE